MTIELAATIKLTRDSYNSYPGNVEIKRRQDDVTFKFDERVIEMPYDKLRKVIEIMEAAE